MYTHARPTSSTLKVGSTSSASEPSIVACGTPRDMADVISVAALPMSIWPHAMLCLRPSNDVLFVSPGRSGSAAGRQAQEAGG